ncbi:MAG: hypothetical protein J5I59_02065 [Saprospiraceae bacterium]|nr:hypothetical protein [Saprospiraceae bacterium]
MHQKSHISIPRFTTINFPSLPEALDITLSNIDIPLLKAIHTAIQLILSGQHCKLSFENFLIQTQRTPKEPFLKPQGR